MGIDKMTDYDDYFTNDDKPFSENLNSGLLLTNAFDMTVSVEMPRMFNNGSFINNTSSRKCGVAIVALRTQLPSSISINNDGELTGTGTVQLRFYPNFNSFGKIRGITWDDSENITINLKKPNGSEIVSDINNGVIESESEELRKLQEFIIEIVLDNATLSDFKVIMEGKRGDRYGAEVGVDDVDGLDTRLTNIETKNTQQDSRLSTIESNDTTQNSRLTNLENSISSLYNYKISAEDYTPRIDTYNTMRVEVTDKNNNPVPYANVKITISWMDKNAPNGQYSYDLNYATDENGILEWDEEMVTWGIIDFQVGYAHCQVHVTGWRHIAGQPEKKWALYRNQTHAKIHLFGWAASNATVIWNQFGGSAYAEHVRPDQPVIHVDAAALVYLKVNPDGKIYYKSGGWEAVGAREIWIQMEWAIRAEDLVPSLS